MARIFSCPSAHQSVDMLKKNNGTQAEFCSEQNVSVHQQESNIQVLTTMGVIKQMLAKFLMCLKMAMI